MRLDVVPIADAVTPAQLAGASAIVIDVLRASTTIITALANGCAGIIPVTDRDTARARAAALGADALVAGERRGEALDRGRDVMMVCSGERGTISLEDHVCAGLMVDRMASVDASARLTPAAEAAMQAGRRYGKDVARLGQDSAWARRLASRGHSPDLDVCLALDTVALVPIYVANIDKIVLPPR
jgi:2-phosphosulfolactate phosphatase